MNRKKVIYIGILLIVTVMVSITAFSYAYLTKMDEQHGKLNMTVGTLDYKIESDDLNNNSITLSANESKEIELTIRSLNKIDSKYKLYTNSVENVTIGYLDEAGFNESTGTISATGTVKVKIVLDNESDASKTITFGVQGGFDYNDVTLKTGRVEVEEGQALCPAGIAYEFDYTGSVQEFTAKCPGVYQLEVWGAQGGGDNNDIGGLGAYTKGNIELVKNTNLYIQVGQAGTYDWTNCNDSTYNGGSSGGCMTSFVGGSGGGSTDIRLVSGNWNDFDSLKSRIMVAAGGAGAIYYNTSYHYNGRHGGGLTGTSGVVINLGGPASHGIAPYAKQTKYDNQYYFSGANRYNTLTSAENGKFGIAGKIYYNNELKDTGSSLYGALLSGGSGGYYGGASGVDTSSYGGTGSSGSSFISGYNGCDAIAESSTLSSIVHTGQPNHYSGKVFTNPVMIDGAGCNWSTGSATNCGANQPQPDGTMATGHSGNGYVRITYLKNEYNVTFDAGDGTVTESMRKIYEANPVGTLPTPTKTGYTFNGWYLEDSFTTAIDANYIVNNNITLYAKYTPITYTIRFNSNGGTGTMNNQTFAYDESKALSTNTFTRSGKTFAGWSTNSSSTFNNLIARASDYANITQTSTGTWYVDYTKNMADTYIVFATATGNEVVEGQWYTLLFNVSGLTSNSVVKFGFPEQSSNVILLKNGVNKIKFNSWRQLNFNRYVFDDINKDATQKFYLSNFTLYKNLGDDYYNGEVVTNLSSTNGAVINLYAVWK